MLHAQSCKKAAGTRVSPVTKVYHMCMGRGFIGYPKGRNGDIKLTN